ncbi:MAG: efflux RND transporter periplasmic adaptor subunit [Ignavibacteria bacterium]|nr:efflux RND transporter periplasmic adaptor subunit [Ignavibacteria bacterium]
MNHRPILALLLIIVFALGCKQDDNIESLKAQRATLDEKIRRLESEPGGKNGRDAATPIAVVTMVQAPFKHIIDVRGTIDSRSSIDILPKASGQIDKILVSNGQPVSKGQLIVELDAEITRKAIEEVKIQLSFATTVYEKQKRIYDQKAGSEIQYLQAKSTKESLEQRLSSLEEQLMLYRIKAPTSGYVDNLTAKEGEIAMPGIRLLTIVNTSDMRVVADLAEPYIATVKVGAPITVIFPEISDTIQARVTLVSRVVNPTNRTFRVETMLPRVPPLLKPFTTCNVRINDQTIESALSVPIESVMRENSSEYVYIVDESNSVKRIGVLTGLTSGSHIQIKSGLKGGERVITRGMLEVAEGQKVRIIQ